jgi:hypothetical protein
MNQHNVSMHRSRFAFTSVFGIAALGLLGCAGQPVTEAAAEQAISSVPLDCDTPTSGTETVLLSGTRTDTLTGVESPVTLELTADSLLEWWRGNRYHFGGNAEFGNLHATVNGGEIIITGDGFSTEVYLDRSGGFPAVASLYSDKRTTTPYYWTSVVNSMHLSVDETGTALDGRWTRTTYAKGSPPRGEEWNVHLALDPAICARAL